MNARIVLRVSTPDQERNGISITRDDDDEGFQEQRCRELCAFNRWEVVEVYSDGGVTGRRKGLKRRSELARCIEDTKKDKGVIVFYDLTRLGRSAGFLINLCDELSDAGAFLASVTQKWDTSTSSGRAVFQVMAVLAEMESNQKSERMRDCHAYLKRAKGHTTMCKPPFGHLPFSQTDGKLVPDPAQQEVIATIRRLRRQNRSLSLRAFCRVLDDCSVPTPRAARTGVPGAWQPEMVKRILGKRKAPPAGSAPHGLDAAS